MIFIKDTEVKQDYTRRVMYGMFKCPYCNKILEKPKYLGKRNLSCGCVASKMTSEKNKTHGESGNKHRLYRIWRGMKARCNCPKEREAKYYKNKGIKVCDLWKKSYLFFKVWALCHGYRDNLTIDRIDNNKNYEPSNCRWINIAENERNRSNNKMNWTTIRLIRLLYGEGYTKKELFNIFDITYNNLIKILNNTRWMENFNNGNKTK